MSNQLILSVIGFTGYFLFLCLTRSREQKLINEKEEVTTKPLSVIIFLLVGTLWMGLFSMLIADSGSISFLVRGEPHPMATRSFIVVLLATIAVAAISARSLKPNCKPFPQQLQLSHIIFYVVIRTGFLFTYEFFLRGCIFFLLLQWTAPWIAILINTILYAVLHTFSSKKEIIGSILFGPILCIITIQFNAVWPAFIIHLSLSAVYEGLKMFNQFKSLKQTA